MVKYFLTFAAALLVAVSISVKADKAPYELEASKIKYRTSFGSCPTRSVGTLALKLLGIFEQTKSLLSVKEYIVKEEIEEKYFLTNYNINYDPLRKIIKFSFDCPEPLLKVQVYKKNGMESYSAILVENGELYDPAYESLLQSESILDYELPLLAIPIEEIDQFSQLKIADHVKIIPKEMRKKISEIILGPEKDLTLILSLHGRATSAFLGTDLWSYKIKSLLKIMDYMLENGKSPSIINLTNSKKVVVKFADKI